MRELSYDAIQFIKKYANLIMNKDWVPLFEELGKNVSNPGEVTDTLLEVGYRLDEMLKDYDVIPYCLFSGSLINSIDIPSHIKHIENRAFNNCGDLTSITIPNSVTSIGSSAFSYCTGLTSVTIPDSVTRIGNYAFSDCTGLTSVTIGNGVTSIGDFAFSYCRGLTSIIIPDSVTSIGNDAFYYCSGLTSIEIPKSIMSIDCCAFDECTSLKNIQYRGTLKEWNSIDLEDDVFETCPVEYIQCIDGRALIG